MWAWSAASHTFFHFSRNHSAFWVKWFFQRLTERSGSLLQVGSNSPFPIHSLTGPSCLSIGIRSLFISNDYNTALILASQGPIEFSLHYHATHWRLLRATKGCDGVRNPHVLIITLPDSAMHGTRPIRKDCWTGPPIRHGEAFVGS